MKSTSKVDGIKENIEEYFNYFKDNIAEYKRLMKFAYKTTMTAREKKNLASLNKPDIELNYTSSYLSKLVGEFSKQTPEVSVSGNGTGNDINILTTELIERYMMDIFLRYEKNGKDKVIKQQCGGSFSAFKIITEYTDKMSFDQKISIINVDPVMCFFDPMAKKTAKDDSQYWGEIYPMEKEEFKRKYPKQADKADQMGYNEGLTQSFSWSYKNGKKDIVILADYYKIEKKQKEVVKLSDGQVMLKTEYETKKKEWADIAMMPEIVDSRKEDFNKVKRYIVFGKDIIEEEDVPYPSSNYFFVAGDFAEVYDTDTGTQVSQSLKSYISNAVGAQKLLNYTAQTVANFSENLMQQKYMLEKRSIVNKKDWQNPQKVSVLLYSSESEQGKELPPPKEVMQQDLPPTIMNTFSTMPQVIQNTLGYSDPRVNSGEVSGEAIDKSSIDNNAVAIPFRNNYMTALNAGGDFIVKLIPKIHVTPTTIPVTDEEGNRVFIPINQQLEDGSRDPSSIFLDYKENDLGVTVKASYSFTLQKDKALKTIIQLMGAVPSLAKLVSEKGLPVIIDQLDIRDADKLKKMADDQLKQQEQQQNQPDPAQQQAMIQQQELQLKQADLQLKKQKIDSDYKIAMIGLQKEAMNDAVQNEKAQAEIKNAKIEGASKIADSMLRHEDQQHKHTIDVMKVHR